MRGGPPAGLPDPEMGGHWRALHHRWGDKMTRLGVTWVVPQYHRYLIFNPREGFGSGSRRPCLQALDRIAIADANSGQAPKYVEAVLSNRTG